MAKAKKSKPRDHLHRWRISLIKATPASPSAGSIPGWGELSFEQRRAAQWNKATR